MLSFFFFFTRTFDTTWLMFLGSFVFFKTLTKCARNTWVVVSSWRLYTAYPATLLSSHSVLQAWMFFSMTVFKRDITSQSVLTWLKILIIDFFLRSMRNAVSILAVWKAGNFLVYILKQWIVFFARSDWNIRSEYPAPNQWIVIFARSDWLP